MSFGVNLTELEWPKADPVPRERVLDGDPMTSTVELFADERNEFGAWRCSPGTFTSARDGFSEFVHILEGQGEIVGDDGTTYDIRPGAMIHLAEGWRGRWVIRATVTKTYFIARSR